MNTLREIVRRSWRRPLVLFVSAGLIGCAAVEDPTDGDGSGESTDSARTFESVGGTAGLSMGSADNGAAVLSALDPGAFLLAPSTTADSSDDAIAPVQVEGGGDPPPPPPPDGGSGDAPPPDGGDGTVPPPDGGDGTVPPPDGGDGTVPPPDGGDGTVPPPDGGGDVPPPPDGFEEFPDDFTFTDEFQEFFEGDPDASGTDAMHFEDLAFDEFFEIHTLDDLFTGLPPEFNDDHFGFFEFGNVPPPPEGFPEFPPPPDFEGLTGDFTPFEFDFDAPPPDDFPEEFFEFAEKLDDLHAFLEDFPVGEPFDGEPSDGLNPLDAPPFDFIDFDEIADFLPEGFLPPEEALAFFTDFGGDHPLIGEEGAVNPELEAAFFERPPIPEGFDGFDFDGDCPQFDDIFTLYDDENIGETMRGQVNTTRTGELPDGSTVNCGDTTVLETVQGQATPLVELEPGVYETQWVVSVRQLTTSRFKVVDPTATEPDQDFEQSTEILGEVQWIVIIKEVDVDGDGIPDETHVHGQSSFETFTENVTGTAPDGLAEPPPLILPFEYEAVLESTGAE